MNAPNTATEPAIAIIEFQRDWIEKQDIYTAIEILGEFTRNRDRVVRLAGTLHFYFEGWDEDQRELTDIPEVRHWFQKLTDAFPYWFVFCVRTGDVLPLALNLLLEGGRRVVGSDNKPCIVYPHGVIASVVTRLFDAQNILCASLQIPQSINSEWTTEIGICLTDYTFDK